MAQSTRETESISDDVLTDWKRVASGSFGCVYKATDKRLQFDVAVKIPHKNVDLVLSKEAQFMDAASCEYVLRVYGRYRGTPSAVQNRAEGIVMEFMEMGCLGSLMRKLTGPIPGPLLPWPLVFRCAHEVALGMNFLHLKRIAHNDLKLSNVLLNEDLHVKIADFGLSSVPKKPGGTCKYMPPEALDPLCDLRSDVYSYGILLWAIFSGKEPYPAAPSSLVKERVPAGQRPKCDHLKQIQVEGLKELVNLMERCWGEIPHKRPAFIDCLKDTTPVWLKHQEKIPNAIEEVKRRLLESATSTQTSTESSSPVGDSVHPESNDEMDNNRLPQQQEDKRRKTREEWRYIPSVDVFPGQISDEDKAKFIDDNKASLVQGVKEVMPIVEELGAMVHTEAYAVIYHEQVSQNKMRELYQKVLPPGGMRVKAALYDAIAKHHPHLI
ncbi:uncharacterized protein V6R79_025031 [Siganus canaliculatus]